MGSSKIKSEIVVGAESRFLANMSHEIRTPMNSILGFIDLVLNDPELPQRQKINLKTAHSSAQYLLHLITDILDISKLESGFVTPEEKVFDLPTMIESVVSRYQNRIEDKEISLILNIEEPCRETVLGDSIHLEKTLDCLIDNAVKFTLKGFIHIDVSQSSSDNRISFSVEDSGIGISESNLEIIFDAFTQADDSATRKYGGAGLGITIAKGLVSLMGGKIGVESVKGEGSRFFFDVPLTKIHSDSDLKKVKDCDKKSSNREFKILLVDDVETNLELARIHLHRKGHTVILARNGIEAIDLYKEEAPDIVLMDIHMPIMDGHKATQFIRDIEKELAVHIPIVALTASVLQEDYDSFRREGFDDVVEKPVNFVTLFETIERIVPEGAGVDRKEVVMELQKADIALEPMLKDINLTQLFSSIDKKMELYNPSEVKQLLDILSEQLPSGTTKKVILAVDMFEFEEAQEELLQLKNQFAGN